MYLFMPFYQFCFEPSDLQIFYINEREYMDLSLFWVNIVLMAVQFTFFLHIKISWLKSETSTYYACHTIV